MKKYILIVVVTLLFTGILVAWALSKDAKYDAKYSAYVVENNPENLDLDPIGEEYENQGQTHIKIGESHPEYNSNPPTSGWHWVNPAKWGAHDDELQDEQAIHNIEHGGIWISYKDIDEETKEKLKNIAEANSNSVLVSPREANDKKIVLASWTRLEQLDEYDEAKIFEFISRNKNHSPEPIAR